MTRGEADGNRSAPVCTASRPDAIAELYNEHFCSVFNDGDVTHGDLLETTPPPLVPGPALSDVHVSPEDVLAVLQHLDVNKATGPDGIAPRLLKETAQQIAHKSLACGVVPDDWKLANIVPVFKKVEKENVENYRPISLLSLVSKAMERCVLNKIREHLLVLINAVQHGFLQGKSCATQLLEVLDYIGYLLDAGKQTDVAMAGMQHCV